MSFFARTICEHLNKEIERFRAESVHGQKMIFTIPAMPESTMLSTADAITSMCLQYPELKLTLKIASNTTLNWTSQGKHKAMTQHWIDESRQLTYYRSEVNTDQDTLWVIVLCGVDRVTDAASLEDFHTCDPGMIWRTEMQQSFKPWVSEKLKAAGFHDYTREDLITLDRIIKPLLTCGRGDLLQISEWLESLNLNQAADIADIPRLMLGHLDKFGIPVLSRFPLRQKRKQVGPYINKASEFYNYTLFLEARQRDKAINTIEKILGVIEEGEDPGLPLDDEDVYGAYRSGEEFLRGLKKYIEVDDQAERARLMKCDFVVIWDQILKFKIKEPVEERNSTRKLSGSPMEVLLTASWMALRDFFLKNKEETELRIDAITIKTHQFKHDVDSGDDKEENAEEARKYLKRLIGGLDKLLSEHINLCNADDSEIPFDCSLVSDEINCVYSKNAEPFLEFIISINHAGENFERRFGWRLPEHHMYRLSVDLLKSAHGSMSSLSSVHKLPVYHVPYYEELLQAAGEEEIRRVLLHSIRDERSNKKSLTNLLSGSWSQVDDPLSSKLKKLAETYHVFVGDAAKHGVFSAVFAEQSTWADLRKAYADAFEAASGLDEIHQSSLVGMLVRAFLIVAPRPLSLADTWHADVYEKSGVATILHPSVIEMLEAQIVYLSRCFNYSANNELANTPGKNSFRAHIWRRYVDLATIQSPLTGLLHNEAKNLTAKVRGHDLIHRIGSTDQTDTPLSTRLHLQYNENPEEDDSFSDTEMFRETSESKLLLRLMQDYFDLHPHARDGLSLGIFKNEGIQPVIAAVHAYLKILAQKPTAQRPNRRYVLDPDRDRPYAISVTLFTESNDETDVSRWVNQWRECWEAAETENKYDVYRRCRFSIAHRIVEKGGLSSFQKLINEQFEADMVVLYNFIGAGEGVNTFEKVAPFDITSRELKFPILEKACCTVNNPAEIYRRKRVVSNRQFALAAYHANLLHSLQTDTHQTGTIVVGSGDFTQWRGLLDSVHKKAEWTVCIDPIMDDRLIKNPLLESGKTREIIGFGSGVGSHGEDNYTVSTERFSMADIHSRLAASIQSLYGSGAEWTSEDCSTVAKNILHIAPELSGLSLVRATGVGDEYIRDFMAYTLSRKMLQPKEKCLCESLISLDAYRHWFDLSEDMRRPDLLYMKVEEGSDHRLRIKMQLVECKLGQQNSEHVAKAKSQIDNGLRVLSSAFLPLKSAGEDIIEDDRPDRRYWWMQLHRLVASKTQVNKSQYPGVLSALERLAEGDFEISWAASVFAFWVNTDDDIKRIAFWNTGEFPEVTANVYAIGGRFVKELMKDSAPTEIDWADLENEGQEIIEEEEESILPESDDDYTSWEEDEPEEDSEEDQSPPDEPIVPVEPVPTPEEPSPQAGMEGGSLTFTETENPADITHQPVPPDSPVVVSPPPVPSETTEALGQSGRILLGRTVNSDQPVYWEFKHPDLANRHMLIFGASGQGKTYAIQAILCEMSRFKQNSLVVDYTNGFLPDQLEPKTGELLKPCQHVIRNNPLPINPFLPQESNNGGILLKENANAVAKRIAGLFDSVYSIGNQQYSVLHTAVMEGVQSLNDGMNLDSMLDRIESMAEDKKYKTYAQSLFSKLRPFVIDKPFSSGHDSLDWDHLFSQTEPLCNVFQLAGMDMVSSRIITEFILWDLYGFIQARGKKTDPKVIVLDEVQNLDHQEGSPLSKYLREGRKFGLSLILATQTMSNMKKDERDRMFNAEHKLFFRPADTELKAFADIAALATRQKTDDWIRKLSTLSKGECYSIGRVLDPNEKKLVPRVLKIHITALEDRGL